MPRVVENQLAKFKTDPLLKQLQVPSEIRYTGYQNCSVEERRIRFCTDCYEGSCKIGFLRNGVNLLLSFPKAPNSQYTSSEYVDFVREPGKVFLVSPLIFNGVCVKLYCWIDVDKMRGFGSLAFDAESAQNVPTVSSRLLGLREYMVLLDGEFLKLGMIDIAGQLAQNCGYTQAKACTSIEDDFLRETMRRKQGNVQSGNAAKSFQECYHTQSDIASRSSCIYDCHRIPKSRHSV